jgi:iron complex outermembrane receptor protein
VDTLKISFFWIFMVFSGISLAQNLYRLEGTVKDKHQQPLPGVTVEVHELGRATQTNVNGSFSIGALKPGNYHIHVSLLGYAANEQAISIGNETQVLNIVMEPASIELNNLVVEESMLKAGIKEQSQAMAVLDQEHFIKNGNASFVRMLESIPGVNSINTGMGVSKPVIRGLSFNRVIVAENGIKQEGQQWGGDHGLEIDQFAVERVELIKGPASLLYGSDGLGGLINIRPAPAPARNTVSASILASARSVNDFLGTSVFAAVNKNDYYLRMRISTQDFADFRVPANEFTYNGYVLPIINNRLKNTAGNERNVYLTAGMGKSWGFSSISFSRFAQNAGFFAGSHGIPRSYQLQDDTLLRDMDLPRQQVTHYKILSNTTVQLGKHWLEADLGYQLNHRSEFSYPHTHGKGPQPSGDLELDFKLQTLSYNIRLHVEAERNRSLILGSNGQMQQNTIGGFNFLIPRFGTSGIGVFAFYRKSWDKLIFNGGIRYDYAQISTQKHYRAMYLDSLTILGYELASPQLERYFSNFSGSTGISWFPGGDWNVKLNVGSAYRVPTPSELTSNGVHHGTFRHELGDSTLTSERSLQSDLMLRYSGNKWEWSVTPYVNFFKDFIFLDPTAQFSTLPDAGLLYRYNQADALHYGAEIQSDLHLTPDFHVGVAAQMIRAWNLETSYNLPFIPPAQAKMDLEYELHNENWFFPELFIGLQTIAVSSQTLTARNERTTPGYLLLNSNLGTNFNLKKHECRLIVNIQNVLDARYYAHLNRYRQLNLPEPGRNIMITLNIKLQGSLEKHG